MTGPYRTSTAWEMQDIRHITLCQSFPRKNSRIAGLMGVLLLLSSCGSASPTSAPAPTPLPTPVPHEGTWEGLPDRWGHPVITFTVAGQQVTALEYRLAYVQVLTSRGSIQLRWNSLTLKSVTPLTISAATFSGRIEYWAYGIRMPARRFMARSRRTQRPRGPSSP